MARTSHLTRAVTALAAAGAVAHGAFFLLFAWRIVAASGLFGGTFGRAGQMVLAAAALIGLVADFVGWSLVKHGGRLGARKYGLFAIAASTGIAAVLLAFAAGGG